MLKGKKKVYFLCSYKEKNYNELSKFIQKMILEIKK